MRSVTVAMTILLSAFWLVSCAPSSTPATPLPSAGEVAREEDVVEHGRTETELIQLIGTAALYSGDFLQVREGGIGRVNFGDKMMLRVFNDTKLQGIRSELDPSVPLDVQGYLVEGGLTGRLSETGGRAVLSTPGGVTITVLGTEFVVIYDARAQVTIVGNFGGTVAVSSAGTTVSLPGGFYFRIAAGDPPGPPMALDPSMAEYERRAAELDSPVAAFDEVAVCRDDARVVRELTTPSEAMVEPGEVFSMHWEAQNNGSCGWSDAYRLTFVGGHPMAAASSYTLDKPIEPGGVRAVGVELIAPREPGTYVSYWQLTNGVEQAFGELFSARVIVKPQATPTVRASLTSTPRPTFTATPSPIPTPTPSPTHTPSPSPTPSPTPSPPDLIVIASAITGQYVSEGGDIAVTMDVTVENQGGTAADIFKVAVEYAGFEGGAYIVPFTVPGQRNAWYPFTDMPLAPGNSVTFSGVLTFGSDLQGWTVNLGTIADSCAGDEFQPDYCRVEESDEGNNTFGPLSVTLPTNSAPSVTILYPDANPAYFYSDGYEDEAGLWYADIMFQGSATDPEDGPLDDAALVWTTDRTDLQSASLGAGSNVTARLYLDSCSGAWHQITLTATDSAGNVATAAIDISIDIIC